MCGVELVLGMALCQNGHPVEDLHDETVEQIATMKLLSFTDGF